MDIYRTPSQESPGRLQCKLSTQMLSHTPQEENQVSTHQPAQLPRQDPRAHDQQKADVAPWNQQPDHQPTDGLQDEQKYWRPADLLSAVNRKCIPGEKESYLIHHRPL